MSLPKGQHGRISVELSGGTVECHSLTLAQSRIAGQLDGDERIICAVSFGTGTPKDEVAAWVSDESTPAGDVIKLLNAIMEASGMTATAQFQLGPGDVPGVGGATE